MILIIINFGVVLHWISRRIIDGLTNYIKQSKVFHPTSEHLEVGLKKPCPFLVFNPLLRLGVWISEVALFLGFDILQPTVKSFCQRIHFTP